MLAKNPGFSLTVVVVLTLGIGLNATVFTLLKSIALSPVAGVDGSASLAVVLNETSAGRQTTLSYPDYQYVRDHNDAFVSLVGTRNVNVSLGSGTRAETIFGELVTGNYFQQLGVRAQLGRTLQPSDEVAPSQHPVVVISDALWKRYFGGDPKIVGKTIKLNAYPLTVVGVVAPSFHGTIVSFDVEVFIPIMMTPQVLRTSAFDPRTALSDKDAALVIVMGRLKSGYLTGRGHGADGGPLGAAAARQSHRHRRSRTDGCSDLALAIWRADLHAACGDCSQRDGRAAAADRLREHHRPGTGPRYFAAR